MPKMLPLIASCRECPNRREYSGSEQKCLLTDEVIPKDDSHIASFCPLGDYPAELIANMVRTIAHLRKPYQYSMPMTLIAHVATKIGVSIERDSTQVRLPLKDGSYVLLVWDYIRNLGEHVNEIHFKWGEDEYRLAPDTRPPKLWRKFVRPDIPRDDLWDELDLVTAR